MQIAPIASSARTLFAITFAVAAHLGILLLIPFDLATKKPSPPPRSESIEINLISEKITKNPIPPATTIQPKTPETQARVEKNIPKPPSPNKNLATNNFPDKPIIKQKTPPKSSNPPPAKNQPQPVAKTKPQPKSKPKPTPKPSTPPQPSPNAPAPRHDTRVAVAPQVLRAPKPDYPRHLRRAGIEGKALLRVAINNRGHVTSARILRSSGNRELDNEALQTIKKWKFKPAKNPQGKPLAHQVNIPIIFKIR